MSDLRERVLPPLARQTGADYLVGGGTAVGDDYSDRVSSRMPLFIALVVGLSIILLMAVFRSVWIPLKAVLLNLLSIGAALGAMTLLFQHGMFGPLVLSPERMLQQMGFGMAVAIFIDAVLLPAPSPACCRTRSCR